MAEPQDTFDKFNRFFYADADPKSIRQGDIISVKKLTERMPTFKQLYPYFADKYEYCVVATQCCDISKSNTKIKVDCIQLIAIKRFSQILRDFSKKNSHLHSDDTGSGNIIIKKGKQQKIQETIRDFLNHNTKLHFFYPPPNPGKDCEILSVCLDIVISLKTDAYDDLLDSRVRSVSPEYRHKLANKIGELFNRIGLDEFPTKCDLDQEQTALFITSAFEYLEFKGADN